MKMNISMDFLKPIAGALKKYTALLPSITITVVALLLLLPTMLIGSKVKEKMETSTKTAQTVQQLSGNVPSKKGPQRIQNYMDKLEASADKIKQYAVQSSQRDLVTYDYVIFPKPLDRSSQIFTEFGKRYRIAVEKLLEKMNALDAPSGDEIRAEIGGSAKQLGTVDVEDPAANAFCLTRAQEVSVYANPSAFRWYKFWEKYEFSGEDQALEDCWDSQVAFWIYEDIVETINIMNGGTNDVLSSPVKRLLGISFAGPVIAETRNINARSFRTERNSTRDIPNYITPTLLSNFLDNLPTARICNEDIDVVHFAVSVLVDSRFVLEFMKELCSEKAHRFYPEFRAEGQPVQSLHNQITILQADLKVVDKTEPDHALYRYGKGAVIRLDLICEYQFNRSGYDEIKPEAIKKRLGQSDKTSKSPASPVGGAPKMPRGIY